MNVAETKKHIAIRAVGIWAFCMALGLIGSMETIDIDLLLSWSFAFVGFSGGLNLAIRYARWAWLREKTRYFKQLGGDE